MNRVLTYSVLAWPLFSPFGVAQNEFMVYPERNGSAATYTSRTANTVVEQFMEIPAKSFAGVGDAGGSCLVFGHFHWATDENAATQESYHIVLRKASASGGPDTSAAGVIARIGPFMLPTATGRAGWRMTNTFTRPMSVPCQTGFFQGLELTMANWPTDGHSIWDARYNPPTTRNVGDNPRMGAPMHAWSHDLLGTTQRFPWCWRMGILARTPILNVGGIDPLNARQSPIGSSNYGAGGLYPDISGTPRRDGLDMRIEDRANPNGAGIALLGLNFAATPIPIPGIGGRIHLPPTVLIQMGFATNVQGVATIPIAQPSILPTSFVGKTFSFQGVTIVNGKLAFTNAAAVTY